MAAVRTLALCLTLLATAAWADDEFSGSVRAQWNGVQANTQGPLAQANAVQPGFTSTPSNNTVLSTELKGRWQNLNATVTLQALGAAGRAAEGRSIANELYAAFDDGAWQYKIGRKIVSWDVGFGFRPNDVVQQEERRPLASTTPEGRPVLMAEHFDADSSWALVWVNPAVDASESEHRGGQEGALAARYYRRDGEFDWHAFARVGAQTGGSLGAAMVWVANDSTELHASVRAVQRYDSLAAGPATAALLPNNPWTAQRKEGAFQALIGTTWTSESQMSINLEAWWDGTALSADEWDAWNGRNQGLTALAGRGVPLAAIAGNLAWQANGFGASNTLRRANLFVRWSQSLGAWTPSADVLYTPEDCGRIATVAVTWQGDRVSASAGLRAYGGPAGAVLAQLPTRQSAYASVVWSF